MPTTAELYELAVRAIDDLYRDRAVPLPEIRSQLMLLHLEVDQRVEQLNIEINKEDD